MMAIAELVDTNWDVIIIGAGMGGGVAGRRLAEAGLSVLFLEKGPKGFRREEQDLSLEITDPIARQLRGAWPKPFHATIDDKVSEFFGPVGSGVGGTSVFYAGALERPEPHDFDDLPDRAHPTGGWPVSHAEFKPYYEEAVSILHVCGEQDPLSDHPITSLTPPPPLSAGDQAIKEDFQKLGLHPYRLHSSVLYLEGCRNCIGHKCPRRCKMDGRSGGVEPALSTGRAQLLDNCDVQELLQNGREITGIRVSIKGQSAQFSSKVVVLAAGAFGSPKLLLSSKGRHSAGCANSSGWVGRGLMFHLHENFVLWPKKNGRFSGSGKSFSLRDLYFVKGQRLGLVQAMGLDASYGNIVHHLNGVFDRSIFKRFKALRSVNRILALVASKIFGKATVFVGLMEDLSYRENRVYIHPDDPDLLAFEYTIHAELRARRQQFRRLIRKAFRGHKKFFLGYKPELEFGHACGTLRFGDDPRDSVLNRDCRAHDVDNLYVADSSFMPSSTGVNPSLTIAANAIRVADIIARRLNGSEREKDKR